VSHRHNVRSKKQARERRAAREQKQRNLMDRATVVRARVGGVDVTDPGALVALGGLARRAGR
jgi:hypothetical protein